ncbi:hypothetical protein P3L10_009435 [Capsicum annuum]
MMKNKTFSCIIFENGFTILSFDGKIIGRIREIPSFLRSVPLTVMSWYCCMVFVVLVLVVVFVVVVVALVVAFVGGVCGGCRWYRYSWCLFVCWHWLVVFVVVVVGKTCLPKEKKVKVDQRLTTQKKATVQRDSEDLPEQSQSEKSKDEERYENNVEGGGQGSIDGDEKSKSEKEKELESEKEKEDDH